MKTSKFFLNAVLVLFLVSCQNNTDQKTDEQGISASEVENQITIIINNPPKPRMIKAPLYGESLFYKDLITYQDDLYNDYVINLEENIASDTIIIETTSPFFEINHDDDSYERINVLVQKGDTLFIDYRNGKPIFKRASDSSNYGANYVLNKRAILFSEKYTSTIKFLYSVPFVEFTANDGLTYQERFSKYQRKIGDLMLRDLEKEAVFLDSLYNKSSILQKDYVYYSNQIEAMKMLFKVQYSLIDEEQLKSYLQRNDHLIGYDFFRRLVDKVVTTEYEVELVNTGNGFISNAPKAFDSILSSNYFANKTRAYLLSKNLERIINNFPTKTVQAYTEKFTQNINSEVLIDNVNNKYLLNLESLKNEITNVHFVDQSREKTTFNDVLSQNQGKVLYIDFWASWCAPCRDAMPDSKKLQSKFKNDDIAFVYVSIDRDFDKWIKASKQEEIEFYKYSYFAVNYPDAEFFKQVKLKSIPRYLIYDKKGNLAHTNAPDPKSDDLFKMLKEYVEK